VCVGYALWMLLLKYIYIYICIPTFLPNWVPTEDEARTMLHHNSGATMALTGMVSVPDGKPSRPPTVPSQANEYTSRSTQSGPSNDR